MSIGWASKLIGSINQRVLLYIYRYRFMAYSFICRNITAMGRLEQRFMLKVFLV